MQILFDIWAFSMTLIKAVQHVKENQIQTPLLHTLYRDGVLYYVVIIGMLHKPLFSPAFLSLIS